jgi:pimeloyl-ACP methyl ester carboxylesterase
MTIIKSNLEVFRNGSPNNRAIIFIHGFPYDHLMWNHQVNEFMNDYYCIAYDVRGLGESPVGDGQYTMELFVDDLLEILDIYKLFHPVLCGLSMGGYIALRAMERFGEKFSGLILCDTKPQADTNEGKIKRALGIKMINEEGVEKFVSDFVPNCFGENFRKKNFAEYNTILQRSLNSNPTAVKGCLLAMSGRTDTTESLSSIRTPSMVICGEHDALSTPQVMKEMASRIPGSRFVLVPNSGHMSPIENHDFVNKMIRNFLAAYNL